MRLLEDHVLDELLGDGELLLDRAVGASLIARHHPYGLRGEDDPSGGDVLCPAVVGVFDSDTREADLEDADALQFYLLSQFEEVFHGCAQFVEYCDDVGALDTCLCLDELRQLLGLDECLVVDGGSEALAEGGRTVVVVD